MLPRTPEEIREGALALVDHAIEMLAEGDPGAEELADVLDRAAVRARLLPQQPLMDALGDLYGKGGG